jgi:hypothetical protein
MYAKPSGADRYPGRHSYAGSRDYPGKRSSPSRRRPVSVADVRRSCLTVLIMLVVQYVLGIFLNLYVSIPASDHDAGFMHEIVSAPLSLTVHALLGLALLGAGIAVVVRAVAAGSRELTVLGAVSLAAMFGAFAAGEFFVRDGGSAGASMMMALLASVALLCYIAALTVASLPSRTAAAGQPPPTEMFAEDELGSAPQYGVIEEYGPEAGYETGSYETDSYEGNGYESGSYEGDGYEAGYQGNGHRAEDYRAGGYEGDGYGADHFDAEGYAVHPYEGQRYERNGYDGESYGAADYEPPAAMPPVPVQGSPKLPHRQPQTHPMPGQPAPMPGRPAPVPGRLVPGQRAERRSHRRLPDEWQPEQWQPDREQPERRLPDQRQPERRLPDQWQPERPLPDQWQPATWQYEQPEQDNWQPEPEHWQPSRPRPDQWQPSRPEQDRPVSGPRHAATRDGWPAPSPRRSSGPRYRDE